jgi:hypothetical protein
MDRIMQRKARRGNLGIRITEYTDETEWMGTDAWTAYTEGIAWVLLKKIRKDKS